MKFFAAGEFFVAKSFFTVYDSSRHFGSFMKFYAFVAAIFLAYGNFALCAIRGADDPNVYTNRKFLEATLEFNQRTLAGAYKTAGHRDPKWDKQALEFLDGMALRMTEALYTDVDELEKAKSLHELQSLGKAARDAGCDDPLVEDMYSVTLLDDGKPKDAAPLNREAAEKLMDSKYPVYRAAAAVRRARRQVSRETAPKDYEHLSDLLYTLDQALAKFANLPGIDRRIMLPALQEDMQTWPLKDQLEFCQSLRVANADAWMTDMLEGAYHISAGWAAHGCDVAPNVSDQGWKTLHEELVFGAAA